MAVYLVETFSRFLLLFILVGFLFCFLLNNNNYFYLFPVSFDRDRDEGRALTNSLPVKAPSFRSNGLRSTLVRGEQLMAQRGPNGSNSGRLFYVQHAVSGPYRRDQASNTHLMFVEPHRNFTQAFPAVSTEPASDCVD